MRWRRTADPIAIVLVLVANPVFLHFGKGTVAGYWSDSVSYATLARRLFDGGKLYLDGWSHVDTGIILPPLLPLLEALGGGWSENWLELGSTISSLSLLIAGILIYLLARRHVGPIVAAATAALPPLVADVSWMGFAPLTEALFIAVVAAVLLLLDLAIAGRRTRTAFALGVACALCMLTRQVGLFVFLFCISWLPFSLWLGGQPRAVWMRRAIAVGLGFVALYGPYAATLYAQTGQSPLTQQFRKGVYEVTTDNPVVLAKIARLRARPQDSYRTIYRKRRTMRALLPDASEMYSKLSPAPGGEARQGIAARLTKVATLFRRPGVYFERVWNNLMHIEHAAGRPLLWLLLLTGATGLWRLSHDREPRRAVFAALVTFYLLLISLLGDLIARYIVVLIPFAVAGVALELEALARLLPALSVPWRATVAVTACLAALALSLPKTFDGRVLEHPYRVDRAAHTRLARRLPPGDALFAAAPFDAYLLNANYRTLPNDTLARVWLYARKTGVGWLYVSRARHNLNEIALYSHRWYTNPLLLAKSERELKVCCGFGEGRQLLYRFRPAPPAKLLD